MGAGPRTRQDWVPLAGRERIAALDVLRGLALLGIALMNVEWFSAPLVARVDGIDPAASGLDLWLDAASYVLVSGKFWVLFALLFGMGFAVMQARAQEAGRAFAPFYLRRTFALLAIGVVHACLIWSGDILVAYALAALLMLACFSRAPVRGLWAWGGALYYAIAGVVALFALLLALFGGTVDGAGDQAEVARQLALQRDEVVAYTGDSYLAATAFRIRFLLVSLGDTLFFLPMALGVFVFGAWLVRSGAVADADGHRRLFRSFSWGAAPLGLALTLVGVAIDPAPDLVSGAGARPMAAAAFQLAGAPLLSLGYLGWVVLALQRGGRWLRLLAPAGRMALTLYLMQSAVGTLVFYGYGFGLWGQVGRSAQVAGVLVVFVLQLVIAHAWMARFRFGPVEWLWRGLTYRALPPLRRSSGSSPEAAS
ncbi:DUF418 domain-containing protein [Marilutibacter chinensis]|uniref:DUF418 domain-containing protein n=1 Tax=Marilutibacter chinensis TaxID=2912247 RepID=A0ABS9HY43_9GAMM|nr:DUF418 domain-containing protein [Lysobacter chinensis]MCF7221175.1 DUF418 domain-containing protein [Lysobacter chinensis]MCF7223084.1 DUF418 domain-containing protein [Lysobacter chinensis]